MSQTMWNISECIGYCYCGPEHENHVLAETYIQVHILSKCKKNFRIIG